MTNRYDNIRPWKGQFSALPIDMLAQTLDTAQKQYDTNFMFAEQLRNANVSALPQDQLRADAIEKNWSSSIDSVVQKYSGDYSQASKELYKLQNQMKRDLLPGGEAYSIQASYNNWQTELQKNKERLQKGDITDLQYQLFGNTLSQYQGAKKDPTTGSYSVFNPVALTNAVDYNKIATTAAQTVKPREVTRSIPTLGRDGRWKYETKTMSEVDPHAVYQAVNDALVGTPGYTSYMAQLGRLQGYDPSKWLQTINDQVATSAAQTYGGTYKDELAIKYEADPFVKQQRQFAHDASMANLKYSRDVSLASAKGEITPAENSGKNLSLLAITQQPGDKFKPVNPDNPSIGGGPNIGGIAKYIASGPLALTPLGGDSNTLWNSSQKLQIQDVISKPAQFRDTIDIGLLQAIKKDNPNKADSDVWRLYNNSLRTNHYGAGIYYDQFTTQEARRAEADRVIPLLATGQVSVQKVDANTGKVSEITDPSVISGLYQAYWDGEKRQAKVVSPGRTVSQGGDANVGSILPGLNGENAYYIVADNRERMMKYNNDYRHRAFDFIAQDQPLGTPVPWVENGKTKWAVGVMERQKSTDANGNTVYIKDPKYAAVKWEGDPGASKWEPATTPTGQMDYWIDSNTNTPFTPAHIEDRVLGQYRQDFMPVRPRSAMKEANNPIE